VRWWSSTSFAACGRRQMRFDVDGTFAFRYACGRAHARDGKLTQERRSCSGRVRQDGVARDPGATVIAQHAERVRGMAIANEIPGKQERSGVIMRGPVNDRASALTRRHRGRRDVVLKKNVLHRNRARSGRTTDAYEAERECPNVHRSTDLLRRVETQTAGTYTSAPRSMNSADFSAMPRSA